MHILEICEQLPDKYDLFVYDTQTAFSSSFALLLGCQGGNPISLFAWRPLFNTAKSEKLPLKWHCDIENSFLKVLLVFGQLAVCVTLQLSFLIVV